MLGCVQQEIEAHVRGGDARTTHQDSDRFRQIADPFSKTSRFWSLFTQWVCTLAAAPHQVAAPTATQWGDLHHEGRDTPVTRRRDASYGAKPPPLPLVSYFLTGAGLPGQAQFNVGEAQRREHTSSTTRPSTLSGTEPRPTRFVLQSLQ